MLAMCVLHVFYLLGAYTFIHFTFVHIRVTELSLHAINITCFIMYIFMPICITPPHCVSQRGWLSLDRTDISTE